MSTIAKAVHEETKVKATKGASAKHLTVPAPNLQEAEFSIVGTAPYCQHKFSEKTRKQMLADQQAGSTAKSKKKRAARDIEQEYEDAQHKMADGTVGIPCAAFRSAMISACRLVGFQMTKAKLSVFVLPDGFDADEGTPLVRITGDPEMNEAAVRLESGVASVAIRPLWREWSATVRVRFDADQFTVQDVANLLMRAGMQVGVGEGRHDSRKSHGLGFGTFTIVEETA